MADPLTDERALALQAALSDEIDGLGQHLTLMSITADDVAGALNTTNACSDWTGSAATGFRNSLGKLPHVLHGLSEMFWRGGTALDEYGMDVSGQQPRFQRLAAELVAARARARGPIARYVQLQYEGGGDGDNGLLPGMPGYGAQSRQEREYNSAYSAYLRATSAVEHLEKQCFQVLDDYHDSCNTVISRLTDAIERCPIQDEQVLPTPAAGRFIQGLFTGIGDAFLNIGPDAWAYAKHPLSLDKLGKFAGDVGTVVGTIGLAASFIAFPADGPGAAALEALIDGADTTFDASLAVKTGADLGRLEEGEGDVGDLVGDGITIVLDGGGKLVLHDPEAAVDATKEQYTAVTSLTKKLGDQPLTADSINQALLQLPWKQQRTLRLNSKLDLTDPDEVRAYIALVKSTHESAAQQARELRAINEAIQYGGGDVTGVATTGGGQSPH